jgi:hypothetical protein
LCCTPKWSQNSPIYRDATTLLLIKAGITIPDMYHCTSKNGYVVRVNQCSLLQSMNVVFHGSIYLFRCIRFQHHSILKLLTKRFKKTSENDLHWCDAKNSWYNIMWQSPPTKKTSSLVSTAAGTLCTHSFIPSSHWVLRQVHSLFPNKFSIQCDPVLPPSISSILSFLLGHPVPNSIVVTYYHSTAHITLYQTYNPYPLQWHNLPHIRK